MPEKSARRELNRDIGKIAGLEEQRYDPNRKCHGKNRHGDGEQEQRPHGIAKDL